MEDLLIDFTNWISFSRSQVQFSIHRWEVKSMFRIQFESGQLILSRVFFSVTPIDNGSIYSFCIKPHNLSN